MSPLVKFIFPLISRSFWVTTFSSLAFLIRLLVSLVCRSTLEGETHAMRWIAFRHFRFPTSDRLFCFKSYRIDAECKTSRAKTLDGSERRFKWVDCRWMTLILESGSKTNADHSSSGYSYFITSLYMILPKQAASQYRAREFKLEGGNIFWRVSSGHDEDADEDPIKGHRWIRTLTANR